MYLLWKNGIFVDICVIGENAYGAIKGLVGVSLRNKLRGVSLEVKCLRNQQDVFETVMV